MIHDWYDRMQARRGKLVHLHTDPACMFSHPIRQGSRLDYVSRGQSCPRCAWLGRAAR